MLISDEFRFVFIHIPKCAGSTVRAQLRQFDSYEGYFDRKGMHDKIGYMDYSHIPLALLREYFPSNYNKVQSYHSFALMRDPVERFFSSVRQRLREFRKTRDEVITNQMVLDESRRVADYLNKPNPFYEIDYVHFIRQTDFILDIGETVVKNVSLLPDMSHLKAFVEEHMVSHFDVNVEENVSLHVKESRSVRVINKLRPLLRGVLPAMLKDQINAHLKSSLYEYSKSRNSYASFLENGEIIEFLRYYYRSDFDFVSKISSVPSVS